MRLSKLVFGAALSAPLLLSACGDEGGSFSLKLQHLDCLDQETSAIPSGAKLDIRINGEGMSEIRAEASAGAGQLDLPNVPYGANRVVTVHVVNGSDVWAVGTSAPFEVTESGGPAVDVKIRIANRFSSTSRVDSPECTQLQAPRAGHASVQLDDGRVLIAGGASTIANVGGREIASDFLTTSEIYDPATGTFVAGPDLCQGDRCFEAAFAQAVKLNDGKVMLVGGQGMDGDTAIPVADVAIYDPVANAWDLSLSLGTARLGHTATVLTKTGQVLVVGGVDAAGQVLDTTEYFDAASETFQEGPRIPEIQQVGTPVDSKGRAYHVAAPFSETAISIAGGIDSTGTIAESVMFFTNTRGTFETVTSSAGGTVIKLPTPVLHGAGAVVGGRFIVVGGATKYVSPAGEGTPGIGVVSTPTLSSQWFALPNPSGANGAGAVDLEAARTSACVAAIDENRLLVVGGLDQMPAPVDYAATLVWDEGDATMKRGKTDGHDGRTSVMLKRRAFGTCTDLGGGQVLITGGIMEQNQATASAEIFTAKPL